ncbi:MAG: hypothetical protein HUU23_11280 [Caldilineales bacterium]|nr:hypothetical protein [Caldilineales bacterium]
MQHTRCNAWAQSIRGGAWPRRAGLFALLLLLLLLPGGAVQAQDGAYPGGYTFMPLEPGPIRLLSLTVDASMRASNGAALADVQVVYRLRNTDLEQPRTLRFAFPGYPVDFPLPDQWSLSARGREISYSAAQTQWWIAEVTLEADEILNLVLFYTAPLGETPFVRFRYPIHLTAQLWPGVLESARVTLSFTEPPNPQSWLQLTPAGYKLTAEAITWSYDAVDPDAAIDYHFMHPSLWERLRNARHSAAQTPSPAAQRDLGDVYTDLATRAGDPALFNRYFPLAVAAYSQAIRLDPGDAAAYLALARLYRQRAGLSQPPDPAYIALSVNQLAAALEQGAQDPAIAAAVVEDFAMLIARARAEGEYDSAQSYLDRLQTLADASRVPLQSAAIEAERQQLAVEWAGALLREQGPGPARQVLADLFGSELVAQPPGARFAGLNSLHLAVETASGQRRILVQAAPRIGAAGLIDELASAWQAVGVAAISRSQTEPPALEATLPFLTAADLQARQQALAAALPPRPEWQPLVDLLSPTRLIWQEQDARWRVQQHFEEQVTLAPAAATLAAEALALENAAAALPLSDPIGALQAELWRAEAEVWQRFSANSSARFTLTLDPNPGAPIVRVWSLDVGEQAQMAGQAQRYRLLPILLVALTLYLLFILALWALWRVSRS